MIEDFFHEIAHNDFTRELSSELDNNKIRYVSESHAKEIFYVIPAGILHIPPIRQKLHKVD